MGNYSSPLVQNTLSVWHHLFSPLGVSGGASFSLGGRKDRSEGLWRDSALWLRQMRWV